MQRVLIANRGEIAIRLARAAHELGLTPLGIASEADRHALHRRAMADSRVIGPAAAQASYLDRERVLAAARAMHADAVHPGYGFLSERADFAQAVEDAGLTFIGPSPATLQLSGDKRLARRLAQSEGVDILPGYDGDDQQDDTLLRQAKNIGFPLLIKASNGGGGRGQRIVTSSEEFAEALAAARREALAAFGDASVLLERFLQEPRHIEFQIIADHYGTIVHAGERDCSVQRRRQKVVEEAPATGISSPLRLKMSNAALTIARAANYRNLGTVEFLVDKNGRFYFLEINARLQVEHPVTEWISDIDLAALQYRIAAGERLPKSFARITPRGWSIEARICAEDPTHDLLPSSGTVTAYAMPQGPGIRIDSGIETGSVIPLEYDSLLAKMSVWATTREAALARLRCALHDCRIEGVATNLPLLRKLCSDPAFEAGAVSTTFLDTGTLLHSLRAEPVVPIDAEIEREEYLLAVAAQLYVAVDWRIGAQGMPLDLEIGGMPISLIAARSGTAWILRQRSSYYLDQMCNDGNEHRRMQLLPPTFRMTIAAVRSHMDECRLDVLFETLDASDETVLTTQNISGKFRAGAVQLDRSSFFDITKDGRWIPVRMRSALRTDSEAAILHMQSAGSGVISVPSPMPGKLLKVHVETGSKVREGTIIAVLEAMKMEHRIEAIASGEVQALHVQEGDIIAAGTILCEIRQAAPPEPEGKKEPA